MADNRIIRLIETLKSVLTELVGKDLSRIHPQTTFFEMGFDSLLLTQVATSLKKRFQVKITFRQLLEELTSLQAIAVYIDGQMPADITPINAPGTGTANQISPATPASTVIKPVDLISSNARTTQPVGTVDGGSGNSALERVIKEQMVLMSRQLQMLQGKPGGISFQAGNISSEAAARTTAPSGGNSSRHGANEDLNRFGPFKGIEIGPKGGLTPRQEQSLAELTVRYNRRTAGSKAYAQRHRSYFCDPRAAGNFRQLWKEMVYPIVCAKSKGSKIWDIDGNEYVDLTLGFGANYFGHSPEFVVEAIEAQLQKGFEIGPQSPLAGEAAKMLCEMTGMERATFCNTGSEAVMAAIRVVRTVTGRDKIVYFAGDYHGIFDEVLARPGIIGGQPGALPIAPGIPPLSNIIVLEYGNPASLEIIRTGADEIAGVIVEPVQSRHPDLQPREFLEGLRKLTTEKDIALIFDEVVTGFRAAPGGAQEYFGIRADLATYGKVIASGMPIGVLAGTRRFMDVLDGGMWSFGDESFPEVGVTFFAGTFVRHPLAMAATYATLQHLKKAGPELQKQTTEKTARFVRRLNNYFTSVEVPIRLQTFSSVFYYDFHPDLKFAGLLFYHMRDRGIHVWEGRVGQICTAHTEAELDFVFEAFKSSVEELQAGGLVPTRDASLEPVPTNSLTSSTAGVPLTEAQREIWIASQMGEDANCAYNESCSLHLKGFLNVEKFYQAVQELVNRHDALRCRFSPDGEYQEFLNDIEVDMPVHDLSELSLDQRTSKIEEIIASDMASPFNLINGPVIRVQMLKLEDDEHQFILTTHHVVCDGWSLGVMFQELSNLYTALVASKPLELKQAMQFSQYAKWQAQQILSSETREAEEFWIKKFAGPSIPTLDLPYDRPRPALKSYNGSLAVHRCNPEVFHKLKKTSGQMGNTVFNTLFSAFLALLYRLSGEEDLVVGIPAAGQTLVGSNDLVGHCLNFLPTRSSIKKEQQFEEFASGIKKDILDAFEHQNYTYGTLIQKLKLSRDASRLPLLSVMFNIDKAGFDKLNFPGIKASVTTNAKKFVNFDLFVNLIQGDNHLDLECEFNTDLFDIQTVTRWLGHFESMLCAISDNPHCPLDELPLLEPAERSLLLNDWNQSERTYPPNQTLHSLFEAQALKTPDAVAAVCGQQRITYAELNFRANHFADLLQLAGAKPGCFVALCLERNLDLIVGILAVLKAGAAYVPMDIRYPQDFLTFYLEDSQASLILTQRELAHVLPSHRAKIIYLDDPVSGGAVQNLCGGAIGADIAYVIYTSGSTGKPKGVAIEHRNAVNFVHWALEAFTDAEMAGVLASTSICFDLSIFELFATLSRGGKVIIAENALSLSRLDAKDEVTLINTVPSAIAELVRADSLPKSIEVVNLAGEMLQTSLVDQIYALKHVKKIYDLYGPTETTTYSTWTLRWKGEPPTIGRPIANTQVYIVDQKLQPTPIGVFGELLIGGDGVARGYLNRPELTAEKFIAASFGSGVKSRVYRTGDLARFRADGNIEFLGRIDGQIKFRGFRIELGEIESVFRLHPSVKDCVVILREDSSARKRLVSYVSLRKTSSEGGDNADHAVLASQMLDALKEIAQAKLPEHMVPSTIVILEALPRTPNGKIDRKALPLPLVEAAACPNEFQAPRNAKEQILADIWMQVLGLEKVSVLDNFFDLGGDSLLSFRIANRASQAGLPLKPRMFFQHKTIANVIKSLENEGDGDVAKVTLSAIPRIERSAVRRR
jgi:amino acid adenylation domain-containing protein